ncbi:hypothetical protein F5B20DRAFT_576364 [Whalleya microplaca]|nr:hypothetical protein F5B20DRAFT_576364 [Whalleya microplaca]
MASKENRRARKALRRQRHQQQREDRALVDDLVAAASSLSLSAAGPSTSTSLNTNPSTAPGTKPSTKIAAGNQSKKAPRRPKKQKQNKKKQRRLATHPLARPGFHFPLGGAFGLSHEAFKNLVVALGTGHMVWQFKPRLQALLLELFGVALDRREKYDVKDDKDGSKKLAFYILVTKEIQATGIDGGDFRYFRKRQGKKQQPGNPGDLNTLMPETLIALAQSYMRARTQFLERGGDKKMRLTWRADAGADSDSGSEMDVDMEDTKDPKRQDKGKGKGKQRGELVAEEYSESEDKVSTSGPTKHKTVEGEIEKSTKKDNRLMKRVDEYMEWLDLQKGTAIDPALFKGLSMKT